MPLYDYKCTECSHVVEVEHSMSESFEGYVCEIPTCDGDLRRTFAPVATHFKGQGWGGVYRKHEPKKNV